MHPLSRRSPAHWTCKRGFTLVEVLVSLVVLSVGLLGMAKLVLVSSHSNDSAYMRSQATVLGYQLLDSMRANLTAASAGTYGTALGVMPAAPPSCNGTNCTSDQLAQWDVYSWKQNLSTALPMGTGSVTTSAGNPLTATVTVQWDDSAAQSAFGAAAKGALANTSIALETVLQ
jgi:type IV pilus assembly protein PilV